MAVVALDLFEDFFHGSARAFQHLREVAGVVEQGTGHLLPAVVGAGGLENLCNLVVLLRTGTVNQVAAGVDDTVEVLAHDSSSSGELNAVMGSWLESRLGISPAGTARL